MGETRYICIEEIIFFEEFGPVKTYGIAVYDGTECINVIRDISVCKEKIEHAVDQFNTYKLELVHLPDCIEDLLA